MTQHHHQKVAIANKSGKKLDTSLLEKALIYLLEHYEMESRAISVLLTNNTEIRMLNQKYRGVNTPTDVLSFPGPEFAHSPLGDIAISIPIAEQQANERSIPVEEELAYLGIHGGLHILGYNDETEEEYCKMQDLMREIAAKVNLRTDLSWNSLYSNKDGT